MLELASGEVAARVEDLYRDRMIGAVVVHEDAGLTLARARRMRRGPELDRQRIDRRVVCPPHRYHSRNAVMTTRRLGSSAITTTSVRPPTTALQRQRGGAAGGARSGVRVPRRTVAMTAWSGMPRWVSRARACAETTIGRSSTGNIYAGVQKATALRRCEMAGDLTVVPPFGCAWCRNASERLVPRP